MELWIRSQDKNVLQKTNALFISNTNENMFSIIDNVNMTRYGTYATKERALEILDRIQEVVEYRYDHNIVGKNDFMILEMPEE